jgi:hypothetical protein
LHRAHCLFISFVTIGRTAASSPVSSVSSS